jgi:hypothetical protein
MRKNDKKDETKDYGSIRIAKQNDEKQAARKGGHPSQRRLDSWIFYYKG